MTKTVPHKQGCDALGGYGNGIGPCTCGAAAPEAQASPVAWMQENQPEFYAKDYRDEKSGYVIPLYTAPRALSSEALIQAHFPPEMYGNARRFVQALTESAK